MASFIWALIMVCLLYTIEGFFGRGVSMGFGAGFICASLFAFWEAGHSKRKDQEQPQ